MKRVAVLMTCYNRAQTTLECLRRLFFQQLPPNYSLDVWLVDDASPDGTGEKVRVKFPNVRVIMGTGSLFWCKGTRLAWDRASEFFDYDFYLLLNDDVRLLPGALLGVFRDYDATSSDSLRVIAGAFYESEEDRKIVYSPLDAQRKGIVPDGVSPQRGHFWFGGNLALIPRQVFRRAGPISGYFHHAYGDADYALRLEEMAIPFFATSQIVGYCPLDNRSFKQLKDMSLLHRIKLLWEPKGLHLGDAFVFRYKHWGVFRALLSVGHIVVRAFAGSGTIR